MRSTAHVDGHPLHPMLIPFPFALLTSAALIDAAASARRRPDWARTAGGLTTVGLGAAVAAAVPGIVDYFGTVPHAGPARETVNRHALSNVSALACFAAAHARRGPEGWLPSGAVALSLVGAGLLCLGGWLGGRLVYHHQVGVEPDEWPRELAGGGEPLEAQAPAENQAPAGVQASTSSPARSSASTS
jgi:uncharacterized membrane protein